MENGGGSKKAAMGKETWNNGIRTAQNMSSSLLRTKSDPLLVSKVRFQMLRQLLANLQQVILGTKLALLFPAIPLSIAADFYEFGRHWIFALSLLGLMPLAERVSFLTEQIAYYTGPTVGGLLNATCGNATKLIIALFALYRSKIHVLRKKNAEAGRCELIAAVAGIALPHVAIDVQICCKARCFGCRVYPAAVESK
ncbi:hypothetical protein V6N11_002475 [Hibiscus sabdariffa]|uniref:Sodium/calcium exchanger membrane region domain-containing protein n=1 Tax=Hibiscus sabdariffa TaxID=183260 RepID=A0ABR2SB18_9ROSI